MNKEKQSNIVKETAALYQQLFDLLHDEHGMILLESEMDEIIRASLKVVENFSKYKESKNTLCKK